MRVETFFTAGSAAHFKLEGRTAVVIDVIRATSTIVSALARGARAIYPTDSAEDAIKLASSLGRDDILLCGERKGLKIEGFDLGNSPAEYTEDTVEGRRLVMSTTNGTRAFLSAAGCDRVLAVSPLNLGAAVEALDGAEHVALICAGIDDRFSLDDVVCAGHLLRELQARGEGNLTLLDDAGEAALRLGSEYALDEDFLRSTRAGQALVDVGLESDLALCARRDVFPLVPEMEERMIRLPSSAEDRREA